MEAVLRPLVLYVFLLGVFSIAGKRSVAEMDTFDMITLLIISEACQNALVGRNLSVSFAMIVIITLVSCSTFMAWLKSRRPSIEKFLQGGPIVLIENGNILRGRMKKLFIDEQDILSSARAQSVERFDQIKFAILETDGHISIIPKKS